MVCVRNAQMHVVTGEDVLRRDEALTVAADRVLREQCMPSTARRASVVAQLGTYQIGARRIVVAYLAVARPPTVGEYSGRVWSAFDDAAHASCQGDTAAVLDDARTCLARLLERTTVATSLCPNAFTLTDLREVYEAVWGIRLDAPNFQRFALHRPGFVTALGCNSRSGSRGGRPARLYTRGNANVPWPPLLRDDIPADNSGPIRRQDED